VRVDATALSELLRENAAQAAPWLLLLPAVATRRLLLRVNTEEAWRERPFHFEESANLNTRLILLFVGRVGSRDL